MSSSDNSTLMVVGYLGPEQERRPVQTKQIPSHHELQLLFFLCRHAGRVADLDEIREAIGSSTTGSVRVLASKLRKKLHQDWIIDSVPNQGMRIVYAGTNETPTSFEVNKAVMSQEILDQKRRHTKESKERISASHIRRRALRIS